ncbi:DUF4231 domain-containing protein [Salinimicrobium gaetbulicola]|uniref:DUF4231 domain-containing protein n=1 Tax=Salinimicrobium gaetbulicola TaxID=999702 RepID=A0ABW3IG74_9FLAO
MNEPPLEYAIKIRDGIQKKAKENKKFSNILFFVALFSTVASPVLILISDIFWLSKLTPAILTAGAALASYWIQLRKPHERWVLYRTAQRDIEFQIDQYKYENGEYINGDKEKTLADLVSKRALQLHYDWTPLAPKSKELEKLINLNNGI